MSEPLSTLLALGATGLVALAIFAPARRLAQPAVSFAPPVSAEALPAFPSWPARIDPRAAASDVAARLALVEALQALNSEWSRSLLAEALADEPDDAVRSAIARDMS